MFDWKLKIWKIMQTHIASLIVCFQMCEGTTAEELSFNCWQYNTFSLTLFFSCMAVSLLSLCFCPNWIVFGFSRRLFWVKGAFESWLFTSCSAANSRQEQVSTSGEKSTYWSNCKLWITSSSKSDHLHCVWRIRFLPGTGREDASQYHFSFKSSFFSPYLSVNIEQNGSENENNTIWSQRPFCYDFHTKALDCVTSCVYCPNARSSSSTYSWVNNSEWHGVAFSRPTEHGLSTLLMGQEWDLVLAHWGPHIWNQALSDVVSHLHVAPPLHWVLYIILLLCYFAIFS